MIHRILIAIYFIIIISVTSFAQPMGKMRPFQKMEELKKIKLIEILEMNEETSLKFFTRRSEHMKRIELLNESGRIKIDQIDEMIKSRKDKNDPALKKSIDEYLQNQENIIRERQSFFKTVSDILTTEQLAKLVVFEERFRNEVSGLLFRERNKKLRDK